MGKQGCCVSIYNPETQSQCYSQKNLQSEAGTCSAWRSEFKSSAPMFKKMGNAVSIHCRDRDRRITGAYQLPLPLIKRVCLKEQRVRKTLDICLQPLGTQAHTPTHMCTYTIFTTPEYIQHTHHKHPLYTHQTHTPHKYTPNAHRGDL